MSNFFREEMMIISKWTNEKKGGNRKMDRQSEKNEGNGQSVFGIMPVRENLGETNDFALVCRFKVLEEMLNVNGTLFGGTVMGWMDKLGHSLACEMTGQIMYTSSADKIKFMKPVFLGEVVEVRAEPLEKGPVRLFIKLTVIADPDGVDRREAVTGIYTFVHVDENHRVKRIGYKG